MNTVITTLKGLLIMLVAGLIIAYFIGCLFAIVYIFGFAPFEEGSFWFLTRWYWGFLAIGGVPFVLYTAYKFGEDWESF